MNKMKNLIIIGKLIRKVSLLLLVAGLFSGCFKKETTNYIKNVSYYDEIITYSEGGDGKPAPDFSWYNEDGELTTFKEYTEGKVVFVNFWATWCQFCKMTFSSLRAINIDYANQDVVVVGIATHERTEAIYRLDFVSKFVRERDMGFPVIIDDDENSLWAAFGMEPGGVPTTVMVDRSGRIVKAFSGTRTEEGFADEIERLL